MSVFTNPHSAARNEAAVYIEAVLGLLGNSDPMHVLESTLENIVRATGDLSAAQAARAEAPGKWSILHVVRHLADNELVWGYRIRRILSEERPAIEGYDQDLWASALHYERADLAESLDEFRALRRSHLRLIRSTPDAMSRIGVHNERGEESMEHIVRLYAGHDLLHIRQIERIRGVLGLGPPA